MVYLYFTPHMDWTPKQPGKSATQCECVCVCVQKAAAALNQVSNTE